MATIDDMDEVLHSLKIKGRCKAVRDYRHFRLYDVELNAGQSIKKLESHAREIGLALRSRTVPIITMIPENGIVQIQITTGAASVIPFNELYDRSLNSKPEGLLPFLLGEQANGNPIWLDMATNPHMLVAGSTGSGKSVFLHTLIANVMKRNDISLYLVDPKQGVEFSKYNNACNSIVYDYDSSVQLLEMLAEEVEHRYELFSRLKIKSIQDSPHVVPKIMVIIDEVSDLMLQDSDKKFQHLLVKISQKSRAVGIHMVLATQRPSVDVLTGLIKANFPARVAFKVSTAVDSRVILDAGGAENLMNRGDGILNCNRFEMVRFQSAFTG
jgi:S-DNA-T family DNA segregation ATPase FtsK/SpoIIIE